MEEANQIVEIAKQMGLIDAKVESGFPNATICTTSADIQASHQQNRSLSLHLEDVRGMMYGIVLGHGAALLVFMIEKAMCIIIKKRKKAAIRHND